MQAYQDHMPMGDPELLKKDPNEMAKQLQDAFDKGADEIKIFQPTKAQFKNMTRKELKRARKQFNAAQKNNN